MLGGGSGGSVLGNDLVALMYFLRISDLFWDRLFNVHHHTREGRGNCGGQLHEKRVLDSLLCCMAVPQF